MATEKHARAAARRRRVVLGSPRRQAPKPPRVTTVHRERTERRTPVSGEMGGTQFHTVTRETRTEPEREERPERHDRQDVFGDLSGKAGGGALLAEYFAGALIISLSVLTRGPGKGYANTMSEVLLRLTALTGIFFVLFLFAGTKGGKAAVWFGLLVDIGILFTATAENEIGDIADIVSGKGTGTDQTTLDSAISLAEPEPAVQLPDE